MVRWERLSFGLAGRNAYNQKLFGLDAAESSPLSGEIRADRQTDIVVYAGSWNERR